MNHYDYNNQRCIASTMKNIVKSPVKQQLHYQCSYKETGFILI
jgi:hypothetical protein